MRRFFFQPLSAVEFDETDDDVIIDDKVITELRGKLSYFFFCIYI